MFSHYDIKMYLSSLSFYERDIADEDTDEDDSCNKLEEEEEITSDIDENSNVEDETI